MKAIILIIIVKAHEIGKKYLLLACHKKLLFTKSIDGNTGIESLFLIGIELYIANNADDKIVINPNKMSIIKNGIDTRTKSTKYESGRRYLYCFI